MVSKSKVLKSKQRAAPKESMSGAKVGILMGSKTDWSVLTDAAEVLSSFGVDCEVGVVSAHRTPERLEIVVRELEEQGCQVLIAGAGGAAHLPGMLAAYSVLPVIGVPVPVGHLQGQDALHSIVQMPRGVPVATVAIGGGANAGILAVQILSVGDDGLRNKLRDFKESLRAHVDQQNEELRKGES